MQPSLRIEGAWSTTLAGTRLGEKPKTYVQSILAVAHASGSALTDGIVASTIRLTGFTDTPRSIGISPLLVAPAPSQPR